jgi:hypothetical protein
MKGEANDIRADEDALQLQAHLELVTNRYLFLLSGRGERVDRGEQQ